MSVVQALSTARSTELSRRPLRPVYPAVAADENAAWLRARFVALVLAEGPVSVLDVGCGGGAVVDLLAARGVETRGVESEERAVAALRDRGVTVEAAAAESLPFPDGAFDWVAMRHVPHHLADERPAIREALRVARRGVVIAEPYFDLSIQSQRVAAAIDAWIKELHRRQGRIHRADVPAGVLVDVLHAGEPDLDIEVHRWHRLRGRTLDDLDREVAPLLDAAGGPADRAAYGRLWSDAADHGLSWNGSAAVLARRR